MSILEVLLVSLVTLPIDIAASVSQDAQDTCDTQDHPVYKRKLEELIVRNQAFEEARTRREYAG